MEAAVPTYEAQRIAALRSLNILDTAPEERFDRVTRTAASVFGVPFAQVCLVDKKRRWCKSSVGLAETERPRNHSFDAHVIAADGLLVIPNAGADERYSDNPAVKGEPFIRFYAAYPIRTTTGLPVGALSIMDKVRRDFDEKDGAVLRDLAAWAEAELNSRDVIREQELGRLQADLISTVAHELRTPLTAIMGFSDLLDGVDSAETVTEYATIIRNNAERLNGLVSNLLDVSRIEAGQMKLKMELVHIPEIVRGVLFDAEPELKARSLKLRLDLPEDLPPVRADRRRVEQVVGSLISNAWNYTLPKGEIRVTAESKNGNIILVVTDTGVGMSPEELSRLFTKFYRVRNPKTKDVGGAGLGLAIARSLVQAHAGDVTVVSEPGKGSTFTVTLPRA
jgi:signal transduction histidine kinase